MTQKLLCEADLLYAWKLLSSGPLQVLLPQVFDQNLADLREALEDFEDNVSIYFAHKPTKSSVFTTKARQQGLCIDVASREELISALSAGFEGKQIECTGIKKDIFLELALIHGCLIVLDSISELLRLLALRKHLTLTKPTNILVRLTDVPVPGRKLKGRVSRFGVPATHLNELFLLLTKHKSDVSFRGFHIHNEKREANDRAGQLAGLLQLTADAFAQGLSPSMLNIGGGLRRPIFEDKTAWSEYLAWFEQCLVKGEPTDTWGGYSYGMNLESAGRVIGRERAVSMGVAADMKEVLKSLGSVAGPDGRSAATFFLENDLTLLLEPGTALLDNCGVSLFEVIETKIGGNATSCVVVNANMYNLAAQFRPYLTDPILLDRPNSELGKSFSAFVLGNMCREEDFMLMRAISFPRKPAGGDLLAFPNTAAYRSDFEDARPHAHQTVQNLVAMYGAGAWHVGCEGRMQELEQIIVNAE